MLHLTLGDRGATFHGTVGITTIADAKLVACGADMRDQRYAVDRIARATTDKRKRRLM